MVSLTFGASQALLQLQGSLVTKERVLAQIIEEREQVFLHYVLV